MTEDSRELFERASHGDGVAVERLMEEHLPGLRRFVQNRVGGLIQARESPSDVVQSACREVLEHLDRFQYDGEEGFRRWLYRTALRKIQDHNRYYLAQKRDAGREVPLEGAAGGILGAELLRSIASPSQDARRREELQHAEQAFAKLPEKYQRIITLAHVEGLPHARIAEVLGITESHSRVLLSRALARLARHLK